MKRLFSAMLLSLCLAAPSIANEFPSKPITLIVPYSAGGGADLTARLVADAVSNEIKQKLVIVNRPGGAGTAGHFQLTKAAPDGYTLAVVGPGSTAVGPHVSDVGYKREDYVAIVQLNTIPFLLVTKPKSNFTTLADMIEFAKKNPPGKVKVGITASGSWLHLCMLRFEKMHGVKFTYVPHGSTGEIVTNILGGHIDAGQADLASAGSNVAAGEMLGLAIWSPQRRPELPNVPTLREQGTQLDGYFYNMIIGPKGMPQPVLRKIEAAFKAAMENPDVAKRGEQAKVRLEFLGHEETEARINEFYEVAGQILKEIKSQ